MDKVINGKDISEIIKLELKNEIKQLMVKPSLVVIQIGDDEASNLYVRNKERVAKEIGLSFNHFKYDITTTEEEIINKIKFLNNDEYTDGIIVQLPIPEKYNLKRIINYINPNKDVDGLTNISVGRLINNHKSLIPCTPKGIMELFDRYNIDVVGKNVVIVGRSILVGKPLLSILLNRDATVTICHSKTIDLKKHTKQADILIVAIGKKEFITHEYVKKGAIVIDVGINKENGKLYGDVDFKDVYGKVSLITPVPNGVGPMTVISLMKNTVNSYKNKK